MTQKLVRDDFEKFHDYGCLIPERIIYFGSELFDETVSENGVDFMSSAKLIKNLLFLDKQSHAPIFMHYSSPGGDWDRGIAVHDIIRGIKAKVIMIGYGCVRSMGTIIMSACDKRYLAPHCRYMIHNGTLGLYGTSEDVRRNAKEADICCDFMYNIYFEQMVKKDPSITIRKIKHLCEHDCYMSGQKAVTLGLADKVLG